MENIYIIGYVCVQCTIYFKAHAYCKGHGNQQKPCEKFEFQSNRTHPHLQYV